MITRVITPSLIEKAGVGLLLLLLIASCAGSKLSSAGRGGEVTGVSGKTFSEPTPYGMTLVKRGFLKMGIEKEDSLWGKETPVKEMFDVE